MGMDLSNEHVLKALSDALGESTRTSWLAAPMLDSEYGAQQAGYQVCNPANHSDIVGTVTDSTPDNVQVALSNSVDAFADWAATPISQRAQCLNRAGDMLEAEMPQLMGLIVREAGKSLPNAISEIREAVDFLRYYAAQIANEFTAQSHKPLGPVVCISPWNFPLAIFVGQVAAALAAGNTVLAKPAEQTPLIAAQAVRILRQAGVPAGAVQLLPGDGATVGAALVADMRVCAVMFTGSTEVAHIINRTLSSRLDRNGRPVPLIAETGGQNAMIVDSSALSEQVVVDVLQSAFDSAGQRCSALRVLCLQEEVADRTLEMLLGAMQELVVGNPDCLSVDVGPVIDAEAQRGLESHIAGMRSSGHKVTQLSLPAGCSAGTFVPPTLIEIGSLDELKQEVFGPVLHVLRFQRTGLEKLMESIKGTGYGLTLGVHTRIDETIGFVVERAHVGNIYVNRNVVGAVVGVQPFGGEGLSGTGPKAGGALYLRRLLSKRPTGLPPSLNAAVAADARAPFGIVAALEQLRAYFKSVGDEHSALRCTGYIEHPVCGITALLSGPTGERNTYSLSPRGTVLCVANSVGGAHEQLLAALATGNKATLSGTVAAQVYHELPSALRQLVSAGAAESTHADAVLYDGEDAGLLALSHMLSQRRGAIAPIQAFSRDGFAEGLGYTLDQLLTERTVSVNTTAAGGNANLMTLS
jgi:RHH-type transcriptional regulator, proline utilization regulon repressor / proline dehydrogenase / delta 1-pyrroline-5-carboxylate dehydrogenase